jgi:hypothetical protein
MAEVYFPEANIIGIDNKDCPQLADRDRLASNNIKQIGLGQPKFTPVENYNSDSSEAGNPIPLGLGSS